MFEKVNPSHPDKVADRIAGAIVDLAYKKEQNPKVAVEVLIGHGTCYVIVESDIRFGFHEIEPIVQRIAGKKVLLNLQSVKQDTHLAENQSKEIKCGDNGIFTGVPTSEEEYILSRYVRKLYKKYPYDGKYIYDITKDRIIACQSNVSFDEMAKELCSFFKEAIINPLGDWTGGTDVDTGATNRKLGSDMGRAVTGGGLHGKDLSKADVSVNIYAFLKAQQIKKNVKLYCAIGDTHIDGKPYSEIVEIARNYINSLGGFEKFAEWGLI